MSDSKNHPKLELLNPAHGFPTWRTVQPGLSLAPSPWGITPYTFQTHVLFLTFPFRLPPVSRAPLRELHDRQSTDKRPLGAPPAAIGTTWSAVRSVATCGARPNPGQTLPYLRRHTSTTVLRRRASEEVSVRLVGTVRRCLRSTCRACSSQRPL